jgi:phosphoglycerate dehydrogenase-like enzyme
MYNVILTPHTAGFSAHEEDRRLQVLADNLRRFAAGEPLQNVVDKAAGY